MAPPPLTSPSEKFPFPEPPTLSHDDNQIESLFNWFVRVVRRAFHRGSGTSRMINGEATVIKPGQAVYVSANDTVKLASNTKGMLGICNTLNPVAAGEHLDVKSVGEALAAVDNEYAAGTCLFAPDPAAPGFLTDEGGPACPLPVAQVVDSSMYGTTGRTKVVLRCPTLVQNL